jgi:hypothetical protein
MKTNANVIPNKLLMNISTLTKRVLMGSIVCLMTVQSTNDDIAEDDR